MNEYSFNKQQDYTQGVPLRISTGVVSGWQNENYSWYCQSNAKHLSEVIGCYKNILMRGKTHLAKTQTDYKPVIDT